MKKRLFSWILFFIFIGLFGCAAKSTPKGVADQFWQAVQARDMETAKLLSTWDTVDYLKYLNAEKFHPERYELGVEQRQGEQQAKVDTVLYTKRQGQSTVKLPGLTVLVETEKGWRVDVKKTLASVVKLTINNVFEQLNGLLQEGVKELDKTLSESMQELGKTLEEGARELRKELSKPIVPPPSNQPNQVPPIQTPQGQQI